MPLVQQLLELHAKDDFLRRRLRLFRLHDFPSYWHRQTLFLQNCSPKNSTQTPEISAPDGNLRDDQFMVIAQTAPDPMTLPSLAALQTAADTVHRVIPPTPQICWPLLCERTGTEVWVK